MPEHATRAAPKGHAKPRVSPPVPAKTAVKDYESTAEDIGIELMPWQRQAARWLTALGPDGRWMYREVAAIVARQNGKTRLLVPLIVGRLLKGRRIMHTAQNRELPREVFGEVADIMAARFGDKLRSRPRFANGQEEIRLRNGGTYRIVAPTRGGARGPSNDDVIVDELREMETFDFIAAAKPTLTASRNPQMVYLSNAGEESSVVLNALRLRAGSDERLAYLEWSAAPHRPAGDVRGWVEANPAMGNEVGEMGSVYDSLTGEYRTAVLQGTLSIFETEHLCRSVATTKDNLVDGSAWAACEVPELATPRRPFMAVAMAPEGTRASVALAWRQEDETIALRMLLEAHGEPVIDTDRLGADLRALALKIGALEIGFDPLTDAELAKFLKRTRKVSGAEFSNASARFVWAIKTGTLQWTDAAAVTDDLVWTVRKNHAESGSYQAVRAQEDRPVTASLAAIRAVWLASDGPLRTLPTGF